MKEKLINIAKLFLGFASFFCISIVVSFILKLFSIDSSKLGIDKLVILELIISFIMFLILVVLYYSSIKKDFKEFKKNLNKNITYVVKIFVIFMITKYLISVLSVFLLMALGYDTSSLTSVNQNLIEAFAKSNPLFMVISAAFLAPIYEEVLFRMGIKKVISNRYLFVIISGLIFGLLHVFPLDGVELAVGLIQSITYVTMGMFLAYSYQKTGNIFTSIGLHFLNNFLSILAMINMM